MVNRSNEMRPGSGEERLRRMRTAAAGLLVPGGASLFAGAPLPGVVAFLATAALLRFSSTAGFGLWCASCAAGVVDAERRRAGPPSGLVVLDCALLLPVAAALVAGAPLAVLSGAGQLANRCVCRAATFLGAQVALVLTHAAGPLVAVVALVAAIEATATAVLEVDVASSAGNPDNTE